MKLKRKLREDVDVGASKAAKILLGSLDRSLIKPASILVRFSGWVLVAIILYLSYFENISKSEYIDIFRWISLYVIYMLSLEIVRRFSHKFYETPWFRAIRILVNLVMLSVLIVIFPTKRHLLILAYTIPVFATLVYYANNNLIIKEK